MRKLVEMSLFLGLIALGGAATAHPTDVLYDTRGECERAAAESAKLDRERLVEMEIFPTIGAAQSTFHDDWRCVYDDEENGWFIEDYRFR